MSRFKKKLLLIFCQLEEGTTFFASVRRSFDKLEIVTQSVLYSGFNINHFILGVKILLPENFIPWGMFHKRRF